MPSVGSSSIRTFGPREQRAADGELLLLAAREHAALAAEQLLQRGKELERVVERGRAAAAEQRPSGGSPRTVRCGKISRPWGT